MKVLTKFNSFLNESASIIQGYPKPKNKLGQKQWKAWLDMLKQVEGDCEYLRTTADELREQYNYNLHNRDYRAEAYEFNVKMHDIPGVDVEELVIKYFDGSEDELNAAWVDFVARQVEHFVEDLQDHYKIDWIKDYYQVGRSAGWLVLELEKSSWSKTHIEDTVNMFEEDFNYQSEELVEYDDETETFSADMKELNKTYRNIMNAIKGYRKGLDKHANDLARITKEIIKRQASMGKAFKDQIESNY